MKVGNNMEKLGETQIQGMDQANENEGKITERTSNQKIHETIVSNQYKSHFLNEFEMLANLNKLDMDPAIFNFEQINAAISSEAILLITDKDGVILYLNQNCCDRVGYREEELIGRHTRIFKTGIHTHEFYHDLWETLLAGKVWKGEMTARRKDGSSVWNFMTIFPLLDENNQPHQFLTLRTDITEKKKLEKKIAQRDKQLSAIIQNSHDIIGSFDQNGKITFLNAAFERYLGYTIQEAVGTSIFAFIENEALLKGKEIIDTIIRIPGKSLRMEMKLKSKIGSTIWVEAIVTNFLKDPLLKGVTFSCKDITKQKSISEEMKHMAYFDFLTGLPNRRSFEKRLKKELAYVLGNNSSLALMIIDIDGFKYVNDSFGHETGDQLLKDFSNRIKAAVAKEVFFGRLGGDEFVFLLPNSNDLEAVNKYASKLISLISNQSFNIQENEYFITASIGVSVYPYSGENMEDLFKNADISMYGAKDSGKNQYQIFSSPIHSSSVI